MGTRPWLVAGTLAVLLALGACSGEDPAAEETGPATPSTTGATSPSPSDTGSSSPSPTQTPYVAVPKGVQLTPPGTELRLGRAATVGWQATRTTVAAALLRVLRIEKATPEVFKDWKLDEESKNATPYFVRARVTNVGRSDLGGLLVPLYGQAEDKVLLAPSTFRATFDPCPNTRLPKELPRGRSAPICLVFLAPDHGAIQGASFFPSREVAPISWQGRITDYVPPKKDEKSG